MTYDLTAIRAAVAAATPGEWETDRVHNEGEYGAGPDAYSGFWSSAVISADGKALFDSLNSDVACVHEEADEGGSVYAWDDVAEKNFKTITLLLNAARNGLLDDAELGRMVRAAARVEGPEREMMALALSGPAMMSGHDERLYSWDAARAAAQALIAHQEKSRG